MRILMLEDNINDAIIIQRNLQKNIKNIEIHRVETEFDFRAGLHENYNIILSDYSLPEFNGMEALKIRNIEKPQIPFIIVIGSVNEMTAVDCLQAGADNYIIKEHLNRLFPAIEKALRDKTIEKEKKEIEENFLEIINRYNSLVEHSMMGVLVESTTGELIYSNHYCQQIFGFSNEEIKSMKFDDLIIVADSNNPRNIGYFSENLENFEVRCQTKMETVVWLNFHKEKYIVNGKIVGWQYIFNDITLQKKNDLVVNAINRLARKALMGSTLIDFMSFSYEVISEFIKCNNFFLALYDSETSMYDFPYYRDNFDSISPTSKMNLEGGITDYVRKTREPLLVNEIEINNLQAKGKIKSYGTDCKIWLGIPLLHGDEVIGVVGMQDYENENNLGLDDLGFLERFAPWVSMKVSQERVLAQMANREKQYYDLFYNSPNAIIVHNNGLIWLANSAAIKMAEVETLSDLLKRNAFDFVDKSIIAQIKQRAHAAQNGQQQPPLVEIFNTAKGNRLYVEVTALPFSYKGEVCSQVIMKDITSEYKAKQLLKESEEKFRISFKTSLDAIAITDLSTGKYIEVNDAFYYFTGYTEKEVIGSNSYELNVWESEEDRDYLINQLKENDFISNFQCKFRMKSGKIESALVSARTVSFDGNRYVILMARIITDFLEVTKQIKISEQKFNEIFNSASDSIILYKLNGNLVFHDFNQSFTDWYGYKKEEIKGQPVTQVISEEFRNTVNFKINQLKEGNSIIFESMHVRKNGERFPVEVSAKSIKIGEEHYILSIERDITDRKLAERKLRDSEEKFRLGFSTSPDSIAIINQNTRILSEINPSFEKLTGFGFHNWPYNINSPWQLNERFSLDNLIEIMKTEGEIRNLNLELRLKNGFSHYVLLSAVPLVINNEDHIMLTIKDISDLREIQMQLEAAMMKAEESDRLKSAFLANMSHEIRTPMNHIIGFTEFIKQGVNEEELHSYIDIIQRSSNHLLALINDIIDISKIEAKAMQINLVALNPTILLKELTDTFAYDKRLILNPLVQIKNLSSFSTDYRIKADRVRLMQVLINLLNNAIKFTNSGSIEYGIDKTDAEFVRFFVRDSGVGIEHENLELIFERFKQAESGKKLQHEGTGLGLALSKAYVELMGGSIWVESTVGVGSTFYFTIPSVSTKNENEMEQNAKRQQAISIGLMLNDATDVYLMKTFLKGIGSSIAITKYSFGADFDKISSDELSILFLSVGEDILPSISILNEIKNKSPELKIVGVLDYQRQSQDFALDNYNFFDFVSKPLSKNNIVSVIEKFAESE